jgi:hypothetical protein
MSIARSHDKKSPSMNPVEFFKCNDGDGAYGNPKSVPDKLTGGPMRERVMGNPALSRPMDPSASTRTPRTGG